MSKDVHENASKGPKGFLRYSHATILAVLVGVMALPTGYFGYKVVHVEDPSVSAIKQVVEFDDRYRRLTEVRDGDTAVTESGEQIRLIGVSAPELDECGGEEARRALVGLTANRQVYFDKDEEATDRFGRLLRYVYVRGSGKSEGDTMVNKEMVRLGYALESRVAPNVRHQDALRNMQTEAEREGRGLWSSCEDFGGGSDRQLDEQPENEQCVIKGNIGDGAIKSYFLPGCGNYKRIKIDSRKGEGFFCTEEEALKAGFEKSSNCL